MVMIDLKHRWALGALLHQGGFGRVYAAEAEDGSAVAVKLIPKDPGASRELLFEPISGLPNVIPILDLGEWNDAYVIVMPLATTSLRQYLVEAGGKLAQGEVLTILADVAETLVSLNQAGVVHRDLKPENVLLYEGRWCLADFGISRYAASSTSTETRKFSMTPAYAAPEQWRHERATSATDVYAFGVMGFEMLEGRLPFPGPAPHDFRSQHLSSSPPPLTNASPSIASLVNECLFKPPEARPLPANIQARIGASGSPQSVGAARLQAANRAVVERKAAEMARASADDVRAERRSELYSVARTSLQRIIDTLRQRVLEAAPMAAISTSRGLAISLGDGRLAVDPVQPAPPACLARFGSPPAFDVIAYTAIVARKSRDRYGYEGRSHSIWFCDAHREGNYRWYELAFMIQPMIPQRFTLDPFSLSPTDEDAGGALSPVITTRQVAWSPIPIDQGDEGGFIERWIEWFAATVDGTLSHPSVMPEQSGGRWRFGRQTTG